MNWSFTNIGAAILAKVVGASEALAGGTGDATKVTGQSTDRTGYYSGKLVVAYKAVLAEDKTIAFATELQESSDNSTWDTAEVVVASTVADTGASGGSTEYGVTEASIDLSGRKRYIRFNVTPDLSATATDTVHWGATFVMGGADELPAA